jgi:hypothetical protein
MKPLVLFAVTLVCAACASGTKSSTPSDRCVQRMMARSEKLRPDLKDRRAEVEAYLRATYCDRFAARGWVYADGSLSIDAQHWLVHGSTCGTSAHGQPAQTVPCEQLNAQSTSIDCAMLHYVRRAEVRAYLRRVGATRCDDGTPLAELGA